MRNGLKNAEACLDDSVFDTILHKYRYMNKIIPEKETKKMHKNNFQAR